MLDIHSRVHSHDSVPFISSNCKDIPDVDNIQENIDQGKSLYCLEPAVLASSGISNAVNSCTEIGIVGGAMNEACVGSWEPTAEGVTSQEIRFDVTADQLDEPFCYGGTSMYMDGFQWIDSTCVIYLFPEWVLKTPAAMVGACIGTLAFANCIGGRYFCPTNNCAIHAFRMETGGRLDSRVWCAADHGLYAHAGCHDVLGSTLSLCRCWSNDGTLVFQLQNV